MGALGPHSGWQLRLFGAHVAQGFGHTPYHVGSSLTSKDRYRDVDVRLILPDDEFVAYFGDPGKGAPKQRMWELAWTSLGKNMTHLPIDFQIQQETVANDEHPGPRSALIITEDDLVIVRTRSGGQS